jgi:hypothetical protein
MEHRIHLRGDATRLDPGSLDRLSTGKGFDGLTNKIVERGDHTPMTR